MATIDLGHNCTAEIRYIDGKDGAAGIMWAHPCGQTSPGPNWIPFGHQHGWTLESLAPLTISPSLLCRICGTHGFIRGSRWEPC